MNKALSVIQTPARYLPAVGGVEYHVHYLARELVRLGCRVKIICADDPVGGSEKGQEGLLVRRLWWLFKVTNTNITPALPIRLLFEDFDIIHTHMPTPWSSDWSVIIGKLRHKKTVLTVHNDMDKPDFPGKLLTSIYINIFFRIILNIVDKIIIINNNWKGTFLRTGHLFINHSHKVSVIPNGVDTDIFRYQKDIKRDRYSLLFVSVLDKHHAFKGLDYLLEAYIRLKSDFPKLTLNIIGDGDMKDTYEKKIKSNINFTGVNFLGLVTHENLVKYYVRASCLVMPSYEIEGFGMVALEAIACGTPVIVTHKVGIAQDILDYKCGYVVRPKNSADIVKAVSDLFINPRYSIKFRFNSNKLIKNKYSWKNITQQLIDSVYKK